MSLKRRMLLLTIPPLLLMMAAVVGADWWMARLLSESQSALFQNLLLETRKGELPRLLDQARSAIDPILREAAAHPQLDQSRAQAEIKRILTDLHFDANGYFFLYDANGVCLAHGAQPALVGRDLSDYRDSHGRYVVRVLLAVARKGRGFMNYRWPDPKQQGAEGEKLGLVELLPVWGWMLGTGLYYDDIDRGVAAALDRVTTNIGHSFAVLLWLLGAITLVVGFLVWLTNWHQGRLANRHLQDVIRRFVNLQIAERRAYAADLHDSIGQLMAAVQFRIETARSQADRGQSAYRATLDDALDTLDAAVGELRRVSHGLRPAVLDSLGLGPALKELLDEFGERTGIAVTLTDAVDRPPLGNDLEIMLYRVAQEALTNIERHAGASQVSLELRAVGDEVRLEIKDDGRGLDPDRAPAAPGIGLGNMRDRVELLSGRFEIASTPGQGTRLLACVPVHTSIEEEA